MSDDYRPREQDHLVEPLFGGLRVGEERGAASPAARPGFLARWFARLLAWLRRARGRE